MTLAMLILVTLRSIRGGRGESIGIMIFFLETILLVVRYVMLSSDSSISISIIDIFKRIKLKSFASIRQLSISLQERLITVD
jgi:hypothetical protein